MTRTIKRLHTNWKQDDNPGGVVFDLGVLNLLTGPTGAGKSAVYEAAQLVTIGSVSDYLGRDDVKDARMLWRSKPPKADTLFVEAHLSDDAVLRWEQARHNGKPTWTLNGAPIGEAPFAVVRTVAELRANLFGSPAKAERWLDRVLRIDVNAVVAEACAPKTNKDGTTTALPDEAITAIRANAEGATSAGDVLDALAPLLSDAKAQAKAAGNVAEALEHEVGMPPTEDELVGAQHAVNQAGAALLKAQTDSVIAQRVAKLAVTMREAKAAYDALPAVPETIERDVAFATKMIETIDLVLATYPGAGACPCCKQGVADGHLAARKSGLQQFVANNQGAAASVKEKRRLIAAMTDTRGRAVGVKAENPEVYALVASGAWSNSGETAALAQQSAIAFQTELQARVVGAGAPTMAATQAKEAEDRAIYLKVAVDAVKLAQKNMVNAAAVAFAAATAKRFPASCGSAAITLRPQVQIGVKKGKTVGAPSGGQEALLLVAMASALAEAEANADACKTGEEPLRLIVMEDAGMDAGTYAELTTLLTGWDAGQLFVPATVPVRPGAPWNTVVLWPDGKLPETALASEAPEGTAANPTSDNGSNGALSALEASAAEAEGAFTDLLGDVPSA